MASQNSGFPSPYPNPAPSDAYGVPLSDPNSVAAQGIIPNYPVPYFGQPFTPTLPSTVLNSLSSAGYGAVPFPIMSAILVELRVMNQLLNQNSANLDLEALRADEASAASGGQIN